MKLLHPGGHRALGALDLALAREEAALESQLNLATGLINGGANGEEAVRASESLVAGRVAATDDDGRRCLLNDLKVVQESSSLVVVALGEVFSLPELVLGLRAAPFPCQVLALGSEA